MRRSLSVLLLLVLFLPSCKIVSSFLHDGEVVAQIGKHKLFLSELESVIPPGTSKEDSLRLAELYINSWAKNYAFLDVAQEKLSKSDQDVSKDLEAYRQSLLRYRYEQHYVNERLDTAVTANQIEEYYLAHQDLFVLERPIMKARFLNIDKSYPDLKVLKRLMSSDKLEDVEAADSIAFNATQRYSDFSSNLIDAVTLAGEFGVDYVQMMSKINGNFIEIPEGENNVSIAYVYDIVKAGQVAPLSFCEQRIKDIIISGRKRTLLSTLEQDLLDDARSKEKFVIHSK